ncbi:HNH endonuclease family protein [Streptomyces sp. BBFR102]|uniref:HNH endonuclease family protein n=1 Tax=Streptomyces sp. BBFR102 TaxID=3448171 RepID=UPI003F538473
MPPGSGEWSGGRRVCVVTVRRYGLVGLAVGALLWSAGCGLQEPSAGAGGKGTEGGTTAGTAPAALEELTVQEEGGKDGYGRERFGSAWADVDGNSCGTRDDILKRDLADVVYKDGDDCVVASGTLRDDPYSGEDVEFRRGASKVDIDHLVALSDAWKKGASQWEPAKRIAFANDPLNLLAVNAGPNRAKGDGDAAKWLPPNEAYHCAYVAGQVAVKKKYGVWVTPEEHSAMRAVLDGCPREELPEGDAPTRAPDRFSAR